MLSGERNLGSDTFVQLPERKNLQSALVCAMVVEVKESALCWALGFLMIFFFCIIYLFFCCLFLQFAKFNKVSQKRSEEEQTDDLSQFAQLLLCGESRWRRKREKRTREILVDRFIFQKRKKKHLFISPLQTISLSLFLLFST